MILDVGCGDRPHGDVNLDLNVGESEELHFEDRRIQPKLIENFVRADAHYLPFRTAIFSQVLCYHTLEHLEKPRMALNEFKRVANGTIEVRLPVKAHQQFQIFFVPKRREYVKKYHRNHIIPEGQKRYNFFVFGVLKNLKEYRRIHRHFLKFLFYTFGSTFFPPIPDELVVTL